MVSTDLQTYISEKVASGQFATPEELAMVAIRLYRQIESDQEALQQEVRRRIREAGDGNLKLLDMEAVKARLADEVNHDGTPK